MGDKKLPMHNQTVWVTGGGSGIGLRTAEMFAAKGASVVIIDIDSKAGQAAADRIDGMGGRCLFVHADVADELAVSHAMRLTIDKFGGLDVLFNNAAVIMPKTAEETSLSEWERLFRINVTSVFLCSKFALPYLKQRKGRIINMASLNGLIGQKGNTAYAAAKGAVISMTKAMAVDYASDGVRVNCVCPAGVETPLLASWLNGTSDPARSRREQERSHLLGYIASVDEIAGVVCFLASEDAGFITGQAIVVDGGASLGYGAGPKAEWNSISL